MSNDTRRLLDKLFRTDQDFDAFCLDHFKNIHIRFTLGMDRIQKENLLLQLADPDQLMTLLARQKNTMAASEDVRQRDSDTTYTATSLPVLARRLRQMVDEAVLLREILNRLEDLAPGSIRLSEQDRISAINIHTQLRLVGTANRVIMLDERIVNYSKTPGKKEWYALASELKNLASECSIAIELLKTINSYFAEEYDYLISRLEQGMSLRMKLIQTICNLPPPTAEADLVALRSIADSYSQLRVELISERRALLRVLQECKLT